MALPSCDERRRQQRQNRCRRRSIPPPRPAPQRSSRPKRRASRVGPCSEALAGRSFGRRKALRRNRSSQPPPPAPSKAVRNRAAQPCTPGRRHPIMFASCGPRQTLPKNNLHKTVVELELKVSLRAHLSVETISGLDCRSRCPGDRGQTWAAHMLVYDP